MLTFAVFTLIQANALPFGTLRSPQVEFLPTILGILLTILALILFSQSIRRRVEQTGVIEGETQGIGKIIVTVVALFATAVVFERVGYIITTFLLVTFLLWAIGRHKLWTVIIVAFLSSLGSFIIFGWLSDSSLPVGILAW